MSNLLSIDPAFVNLVGEPFVFVLAGREENERTSEPHAHTRGQLFGSTRGVLTVVVENAVWIVPAIHAVWLPPHHVRWARSHGWFEGWAVYIDREYCADLPDKPCALRISGVLREAIGRAASWPVEPLKGAKARLALVILDEIRDLPAESLDLPMPTDARLARIAQALIEDPSDSRDLVALAHWAGASARTVSRLFVTETGFTFTAWRQRARLMLSLELLAQGHKITSIALDLGFSSGCAFIMVFRRAFGETPANYQRHL